MSDAFWIVAPLLGVAMMTVTGWAAFTVADWLGGREFVEGEFVGMQEIMEGQRD